jgi:hypothetical protein
MKLWVQQERFKKKNCEKKINKNSFYFLLAINIYAFLFLQFTAVVDISSHSSVWQLIL